MSKVKKKAARRGRREHPQEERVFSANFLPQIIEKGGCFVPLEDFQKLQKKYMLMFKCQQKQAHRLKLFKMRYEELNELVAIDKTIFGESYEAWNAHLIWMNGFFQK